MATEQEYAAAYGTAWCGTCRRQVAIADEYESDTGDERPRVQTFIARPLFCGHDASTVPEPVRAPSDDGTAALLASLQDQQRLARTAAAAARHGDL